MPATGDGQLPNQPLGGTSTGSATHASIALIARRSDIAA